ncbi:MAG: ribonuclease PH [Deltaproteobacteria bacterium RIFCSPHIGHO2_02_FULL_40_11]|nr:MAG: ribonuclease PH [Deltaproteobacteria bacterium RIFCSPHIGHO2_02_FULL_40_11]
MMRPENRASDQHREVKITPNYLMYPQGSALIEIGNTKVVCTATLEDKVPPFLQNSKTGWVTSEYAMLPAATNTRTQRDRMKISGRTQEIQRLIGRSLRSVVDFRALGERSIFIDCDVLQADGGTRTASITGGFVALALCIEKLLKGGVLSRNPIKDYVAAISIGLVEGETLLDLEYAEDSQADVDMNLVMTGSQKIVEIQGTAEKKPFTKEQQDEMLDLGWRGVQSLISIQKEIVHL